MTMPSRHIHVWRKVYRFDGKDFYMAGLWLKTEQGGHTQHQAKVCVECGQIRVVLQKEGSTNGNTRKTEKVC